MNSYTIKLKLKAEWEDSDDHYDYRDPRSSFYHCEDWVDCTVFVDAATEERAREIAENYRYKLDDFEITDWTIDSVELEWSTPEITDENIEVDYIQRPRV